MISSAASYRPRNHRQLLGATIGLSVFLVAVLAAGIAHAQAPAWVRAYEDGISAYADGQYARAEQSLAAAFKAEPRQSRNKRFVGMLVKPYVPQYYLALIYARTGRVEQARSLLQQLTGAGLVDPKDPDYQFLVDALRGRPTSSVAPPPTITTTTARPTPPPTVLSTVPTTVAPVPKPNTVEIAASAAEQALKQKNYPAAFDAIDQMASAGGATTAVSALRRRVATAAIADGAEFARANRFRAAEQVIALVERRAPGPEAAGVRRQLRIAMSERDVLRTLLEGRYEAAVAAATRAITADLVSGRILFYGACGRASLGLRDTATGQTQITTARQLYARARTLQPQGFSRDRRYISPEVLRALEAPR